MSGRRRQARQGVQIGNDAPRADIRALVPSLYRGRLLNAEGEAPISRLNAAANLLGLLYPALIAAAEMLFSDRSAFDAASIRRLRT